MTAVDTRVVVTEPGVVYDLPMVEYLADPVPGGSLSSHGARLLLPPSCPAKFAWYRDNPEPPKDAYDLGSAAHDALLGGGPEIVVVDAPDWRTKAAKEAAAEARARGAVPILADTRDQVRAMVDKVRAHPFAGALFDGPGSPEASLFWTDPRAGIWCRGRLDWLPDRGTRRRLVVADYKTARSADPEKFARGAADYGYHQQAAWYLDGLRALGLDDDPVMVFVVQETEPPFLVSVVQLDVIALRIGGMLNRRAVDIYQQCSESDRWPGYGDTDVILTPLPAWVERRYESEIS